MTQKEIAGELGVGANYLSQVFKGRKPGPALVASINRLHKDRLSLGDSFERSGPLYGSETFANEVARWASGLGMSPNSFIERVLLRAGQATFEEIRREQAQNPVDGIRSEAEGISTTANIARGMVNQKRKETSGNENDSNTAGHSR